MYRIYGYKYFVWEFANTNIYRVEKVNKKDVFLYDLENVERELQDYLFRTKIRKLTEEELQFMKASASESPTLPRILISE